MSSETSVESNSWALILRGMAARPYVADSDNILSARDCRTLRRAADEFDRVYGQRAGLLEALEQMVNEKVDYMTINNLGDPETQHTIKSSRAAIARAQGKE
jgi:hypothetical protein